MAERFALPGFQTPGSPKADSRVFGSMNSPIEIPFLCGRPLEEPMRSFEFGISLDRGPFMLLLAYSNTNHFVYVRQNDRGTKDYVLKILPDELALMPATFTVRIMEQGREITRRTLTTTQLPVPGTRWAIQDLPDWS